MTDPANARVLIYAAGSTQATGVLGQPDLKTGLPWGDSWNTLHDWRQELFAKPAVPVTASTFRWPSSVAVDPAGTVYVSDSGNNGVLFFARGATVATRASGQPDLTSRIKDLASDFEWRI